MGFLKKFLIGFFFFGLALINTYPLIKYFRTGIPYTHHPVKGYEVTPLIQGDHLQLYYVLWLFKDALTGNTPLFSDPYQFSFKKGAQSSFNPQFFPMSLIFLLFSGFGNIAAYNTLVILSYILAGISGYLLINLYTEYTPSALLGGIVFSLFPYRVSQTLGGHPNGFLFFLIPLMLYFLEQSLRKNSKLYAIYAGLSLLTLSLLESHLFYYSLLFMPFFLGFRILYPIDSVLEGREKVELKFTILPFLIGIVLAIITIEVRSYYFNPFKDRYFYLSLLFPLILWSSSILYGIAIKRLFELPLRVILKDDSITYLPFLLFILYPLKILHHTPHLAEGLFLSAFAGGIILKSWNLYTYRNNFKGIPGLKKILLNTLLPLSLFILLSIGIGILQHLLLSKTLLSGGRRFEEVKDYSPFLLDIFKRESINVERYIYLGYSLLLIASFAPIFGEIKSPNFNFFLSVFGVSLLLVLGPNLDPYLPLYYIMYKYLPGFSYQRVAGRMITLSILSLSVLAGYGLKTLAESLGRKSRYLSILVLILVILDLSPFKKRGITILPKENKVYEFIKNNIREGERVLEIPIWPGNSSWTSIYQYYVTLYRYRMINGYSAYVTKGYFNEVFLNLYPLNFGEIRVKEYETLKRFKIRYVTMHKEAFSRKVSPFPFLFSLNRMRDSPFVRFIKQDGPIYLFEVMDNPKTFRVKFKVKKSYSFIWEAEDSKTFVGKVVKDLKASKGRAIFGEAGGGEGFLISGQYINLPTGRYDARFRLKIGDLKKHRKDEEVALVEVTSNIGEKKLSKRMIKVGDFGSTSGYRYFDLPFILDYPALAVEFRVYFKNRVDIWVDCVYVRLNKDGYD